jgi:uncharacterized protein (TIGR01440 family)
MYMDIEAIRAETRAALAEFLGAARLEAGDTVVVGCSTSEIAGGDIGRASSPEIGVAVFEEISGMLSARGLCLAAQCCEHLNRAIVAERETAARLGLEIVSAVPAPKAGGSFAAAAYAGMSSPVLAEEIRAAAGLDIGGTLIGMHLRRVAVPVKLKNNRVGAAAVSAAGTRPRFIGGARTSYGET